jgi:hypothetical protein
LRHERTLKTILRMIIINGFVATVKIKTWWLLWNS